MAYIASTAKFLAEHIYSQEAVEPWLIEWAERNGESGEIAARMCRNAQVFARSAVIPIEEIFRPQSLARRNEIYREKSIALGSRVCTEAIARAGLSPRDIDLIISVSCTGFMIPSVDAYLIDTLEMRPGTKRLPITELGCAAGAAGLSRAREYLCGYPNHRVLLLSVELPSLTFQPDDLSMDNIVSAAIFGDGAAAAVLTGHPSNGAPRLADSRTCTLPRSASLMSFDLLDSGFHIRLSKDIPRAVREKIRPIIEAFLDENSLRLEDIDHLIFHPGGKRILEVYRDELGVAEERLRFSHQVLRECGNISSSTVLMVLDAILRRGEPQKGDTGLILALGPGFSIEMLLAEW